MNDINKRIIDGDSQLDTFVFKYTESSKFYSKLQFDDKQIKTKTGGDDVDDGNDGENENGNMQM